METKLMAVVLELTVLACCMAQDPGKGNASPAANLTITILYDNTAAAKTFKPDWGFSCFVDGLQKTILFDTGTKPDVLMQNMKQAHVDRDTIQCLVISHTHGDHTGGLREMIGGRKLEAVSLPEDLPSSLTNVLEKANIKRTVVSSPLELFPNAHLTGAMGMSILEQSLIIDTPQGLVLITGCSHPGIVSILEKAKEMMKKEILLVLGGFHLLNHTDEEVREIIATFKSLGVRYCGASHCTGEKAIAAFREAFGDHFVELGAGRRITVGKAGVVVPGL